MNGVFGLKPAQKRKKCQLSVCQSVFLPCGIILVDLIPYAFVSPDPMGFDKLMVTTQF